MIPFSYLPGCSTEPWSPHDAAPLRSSFCSHHPAGRCGIFAQPFPRLTPARRLRPGLGLACSRWRGRCLPEHADRRLIRSCALSTAAAERESVSRRRHR